MDTFKERLLEERNQLKEKLNKLTLLVKSQEIDELKDVQQSLLIVQESAMRTYLMCLQERIYDLEIE